MSMRRLWCGVCKKITKHDTKHVFWSEKIGDTHMKMKRMYDGCRKCHKAQNIQEVILK